MLLPVPLVIADVSWVWIVLTCSSVSDFACHVYVLLNIGSGGVDWQQGAIVVHVHLYQQCSAAMVTKIAVQLYTVLMLHALCLHCVVVEVVLAVFQGWIQMTNNVRCKP